MFCPSCQAEFRSGFTRCSDCGVALVAEHEEARPKAPTIREGLPPGYDELLWRGDDAPLYLRLLSALGAASVPCFGKGAYPPLAHSAEAAPRQFEIWISGEERSLARWILDSSTEEREGRASAAEEPQEPEKGEPYGVCP